MSANSGPGFRAYPNHRITTNPAGVHVQVRFNGEVIADTIMKDGPENAVWTYEQAYDEMLAIKEHLRTSSRSYPCSNAAKAEPWTMP